MTTRFRTRGAYTENSLISTGKAFQCATNCCAPGQTFGFVNLGQWDSAIEYVGERRTMTDTVVKDFKTRSAKGEVFMNFMNSTKATLNPTLGRGLLSYSENSWQCGDSNPYKYQKRYDVSDWGGAQIQRGFSPVNGHWTIPSTYSVDDLERMIREASTAALNKRGRPDFDLWETLAEYRLTMALLAQYLAAARKATAAMAAATNKRGSLRSLAHLGEAGVSAHLMTEFGLKPVLKSIKDVVRSLEKSSGEVRQTARATVVDGRSSVIVSDGPFGSSLRYAVTTLRTEEVTVRAMSLDEYYVSMLENFGLSSKGLFTLPWELITLSFVADSFVNIGNFIGASIPTPQTRQLGSCITIRRTSSLTNTLSGVTPVGIAVVHTAPSGCVKTGVFSEYTRHPGSLVSGLVIRKNFGLNPDLQSDISRIVNYSALVAQSLLGVRAKVVQAVRDRKSYTE